MGQFHHEEQTSPAMAYAYSVADRVRSNLIDKGLGDHLTQDGVEEKKKDLMKTLEQFAIATGDINAAEVGMISQQVVRKIEKSITDGSHILDAMEQAIQYIKDSTPEKK